jgi:type VI secretion system protein ImpJ
MFLTPQHFQAADRHTAHQGHLRETWDQPYYWGIQDIDLDEQALANQRLVIRSLKARLRDGTLVATQGDKELPEVNLQPRFGGPDSPRALYVLLAVPALQDGRANAAPDSRGGDTRYLVGTEPFADENRAGSFKTLQFRRVNLQLILTPTAQESPTGYETLILGRILKSYRDQQSPKLDPDYFPPLIACSAWNLLWIDLLQKLSDRIGERIVPLAAQVISRITFDSKAPGDQRTLAQLRVLNEAYALFANLFFVTGVHPLPVYLELCRLVGQLSIFDQDRCTLPGELPRYDHDNLAHCYYTVLKYIDHLITKIPRPNYETQDFEGYGLQMRAPLQAEWLEPPWELYVGVESELNPTQCADLLTSPRILNLKIGSSERVEEIVRRRLAGLTFSLAANIPPSFPRGLTYFFVKREPQPEWDAVRLSRTLAIRLNETQIVGSIDKKHQVMVRYGAETTALKFTLYLIKQEIKSGT